MRNLSNSILAQLYAQESDDPFLTLFTLSHPDWSSDINWVNNTESIVSNGTTFEPFPISITLPTEDGETLQSIKIEFDNVSREVIEEIRSATENNISVAMQMILASNPDVVEIELGEMTIVSVNYDAQKVTATLTLDDFLNTEITGEKYTPTLYPGLF